MPETLPPHAQRWAKILQDAIVTDSAIREGLQDDDAVPFLAWGKSQAERVAARWVAQGVTPDEEQLDEAAGALMDLMTNINWAVRYRHKKGTAWLINVLRSLNTLSRELLGTDAPTLDEEVIAAWVADDVQHADGQVLRDLLAQLTPSEDHPAAPPLPGRKPPGPASALGQHSASPPSSGGGLLGDLLKRLTHTPKENPPPTESPPPAQSLGDMLDDTPQARLQRALHDISNAGNGAQDASTDPNAATSSGEDHDQTQ